MKISPVAGPASVAQNTAQDAQKAATARERAIAVLQGSNKAAPQPAQVEQTPPAVAHAQANSNVSEGQSEQVEAPVSTPEVPAPSESKTTEEPISSQYAVLARREKAYRAKVQAQDAALKAREAELAEREAKLTAKDSTYEKDYIPKSKLTEDTIQTLLEAGISYEKITEMALEQQGSTLDPQTKRVIQKLQEEIKELKADSEGTKKSITKQQEENYKQAVNQIRQDVKSLVTDGGEEFEAINATDSVDDVVELIEKTFKEDGILLTNEEAAKEVEKELIERISKYSRLSKIQQKYQTQSKASPETSVKTASGEKQPQSPKTLTNGMTNSKQLSSRERAILAFEGKLSK